MLEFRVLVVGAFLLLIALSLEGCRLPTAGGASLAGRATCIPLHTPTDSTILLFRNNGFEIRVGRDTVRAYFSRMSDSPSENLLFKRLDALEAGHEHEIFLENCRNEDSFAYESALLASLAEGQAAVRINSESPPDLCNRIYFAGHVGYQEFSLRDGGVVIVLTAGVE